MVITKNSMGKKRNNRIIRLLVYILIIGSTLGLIGQYSSKVAFLNEKRKLKNSPSRLIVYGKINSISRVQKSSKKLISYQFYYGNSKYHKRISDVFTYKCSFEYQDKLFPIVIDSLNPNRNCILFHKRDYNYFGYHVPDSMNWVFECVSPEGSYIFATAPISPD